VTKVARRTQSEDAAVPMAIDEVTGRAKRREKSFN
jgi:hypothetical protein